MTKPLAAAIAFLAAAPAYAQEGEPIEGPRALDVTLEVSALSDYRFRGVSRSGEDPAGQASLLLFHESGVYGGLRGTTLAGREGFRARDPGFGDLGDVQGELFAGWRGDVGGGFDLDAGVAYYAFAGGDGPTDYAEPYASLGYLIGPLTLSGGAKYAPAQDGIGGEDMLYLFGQVDLAVPFRPWAFSAQLGHQDWGFARCGLPRSPQPCPGGMAGLANYGDYWTWSLGVEHHVQMAGIPDTYLGLRYVDTDLAAPGADAGLVGSLTVRF